MNTEAGTEDTTLGLTLSGGGFRAALFHLGVITFLRQSELLGRVKHICSVSGGSILAAHLVLNWERYTLQGDHRFWNAADELVRFVQRDVRGRIQRRWLLSWLLLLPRLWGSRVTLPGLLEAEYEALFSDSKLFHLESEASRRRHAGYDVRLMPLVKDVSAIPTEGTRLVVVAAVDQVLHFRIFDDHSEMYISYLDEDETTLTEQARQIDGLRKQLVNLWPPHDLTGSEKDQVVDAVISIVGPARPELYLLATSMTTGELVSFDKMGFRLVGHDGEMKRFNAETIRVTTAVASSSAFPPMFPPVRLSQERLGFAAKDFQDHYLTDGGVFDNVGIRMMRELALGGGTATVVVSDAGAMFDWAGKKPFRSFISRMWRTTDILMKRVGDLEYASVTDRRSRRATQWVRCGIDESYEYPWLSTTTQRAARFVRTDLNAFNDLEIVALTTHGYLVASKVLGQALSAQLQSDYIHEETLHKVTLHKFKDLAAGEFRDRGHFWLDIASIIASRFPGTPLYRYVFDSGGKRFSIGSRKVRLNLWAWRDWATWAILAIVVAYMVGLALLVHKFIMR